jgi:hypothetical protein
MIGGDGAGPDDVVRARRFEVVDANGVVRVVLGDLAHSRGGVFGIALLGSQGQPRVWIEVDGRGPALVFDQGGNDVVELGVDDPVADALHVGAYLHLSGPDGRPAVSWRVEEDGSVTMRTAGPER